MAYSALARLWASKVEDGTKNFWEVPSKYKEEVRAILTEHGREDLIIEEEPTEKESSEENNTDSNE